MNYNFFLVEIKSDVIVVTINRPEVLNALHPPASHELSGIIDSFEENDDLKVMIITGSGDKAFCSGNDLKYKSSVTEPIPLPLNGFGGLTARFNIKKPIISAVNGFALAGGMELILASDLCIATEKSIFGLPEPSVGLIATSGGVTKLPKMIPHKIAMDIILCGRKLSAQEALSFGLINKVVKDNEFLIETALEMARSICKSSTLAVKASKEISNLAVFDKNFKDLYFSQKTVESAKKLYESKESINTINSFLKNNKSS